MSITFYSSKASKTLSPTHTIAAAQSTRDNSLLSPSFLVPSVSRQMLRSARQAFFLCGDPGRDRGRRNVEQGRGRFAERRPISSRDFCPLCCGSCLPRKEASCPLARVALINTQCDSRGEKERGVPRIADRACVIDPSGNILDDTCTCTGPRHRRRL